MRIPFINTFFRKSIIITLVGFFVCTMTSCYTNTGSYWKKSDEIINSTAPTQTIMVLGNQGVGKSSLLNAIAGTKMFDAGVSVGRGTTITNQCSVRNGVRYMDTPGLADVELRQQAVKEIEKALKEDRNSKIVFVATLEAGRIRPDDLTTINTICEAIKADFNYGLIFNKVTQRYLRSIEETPDGWSPYLSALSKKPASFIFINKNYELEDADNVYLPADSADRKRLIDFIHDLPYALKVIQSVRLTEAVMVLGNPGVGKSSLINSILQEGIFKSGISMGLGLTKEIQSFVHGDIKYIDTPGLSDINNLMEQRARQIEKALKEDNNYKIVFVINLPSGRIRVDDLITINLVCNAIKTEFTYGIVINKVTKAVEQKVEGEPGKWLSYFRILKKQPASLVVINKDEDMEDQDNKVLPANSPNRAKLLDFIAKLPSNVIPANAVEKIKEDTYEEMRKAFEEMITKNQKID